MKVMTHTVTSCKSSMQFKQSVQNYFEQMELNVQIKDNKQSVTELCQNKNCLIADIFTMFCEAEELGLLDVVQGGNLVWPLIGQN